MLVEVKVWTVSKIIPGMLSFTHLLVFVIHDDQTSLSYLMNNGANFLGKSGMQWLIFVFVKKRFGREPRKPINVENVNGWPVRERIVGFPNRMYLPVWQRQGGLSVDTVSIGGIWHSLIGLHADFSSKRTAVKRIIIAPIYHELDEGVTSILEQTKTGVIVHCCCRMRNYQWPFEVHFNGQTDTNRGPIGYATSESFG